MLAPSIPPSAHKVEFILYGDCRYSFQWLFNDAFSIETTEGGMTDSGEFETIWKEMAVA
jgi:hypothetical protein